MIGKVLNLCVCMNDLNVDIWNLIKFLIIFCFFWYLYMGGMMAASI